MTSHLKIFLVTCFSVTFIAQLFSQTYNVATGTGALYSNTTGSYNVATGYQPLYSNTTGSNNIAFGFNSLFANTTGIYNIATGYTSMYYNTTGIMNVATGSTSLYSNTTGNRNTAIGSAAMCSNSIGSDNSALGYYAGRFIANGTTGNATGLNSVFIGSGSRAHADAESNQIVIGYNAIGNGSKTVTLGNDEIISTFLKGNVGVGTVSLPAEKLDINGNMIIRGNSITTGNGYSIYGPNSTWGAKLRVGGNGNVTNDASVVATNGNLHLDAATGNFATYINYYHGSAGINFGNGAEGVIGSISPVGNLSLNGTGLFGSNTLINGQGVSYFNGGNVGIGTTAPVGNLEVASSTGATLSITTNKINGSDAAPLRPTLDFLGYANGNKARISAKEATYNTHSSTLSMFVNDGTSATSLIERLRINANGNVSIGTTDVDPTGAMLTVKGKIHANEIIIDVLAPIVPDYVFHPTYKLMPLNQVEQYVKTNSHLPEIPSAAEVSKNGMNMGEMQNKLLQKVEELTLYVIEQQKQIEELKKQVGK